MWEYVLADRAGNRLGELREASPRAWRRGRKSGRSASFTMPTSAPLANRIPECEKLLLLVYDDRDGTKRLRHCGPLVGGQRTVDGPRGTVTANSMSPLWRVLKRQVGRGTTPTASASIGTALATVDRGEALGQLVDALNLGSVPLLTKADDTGIRRGAIVASSASYWGPWRFTNAMSAWREIVAGLDAPEVDVRPVDPVADATGLKIASLDVAPALGSLRPHVVFEHGTGRRNVPQFTDVFDAGGVANDVWHLPVNWPDNTTQVPLEASDSAAGVDRGLQEDVVDAAITTDFMRNQLLLDHLAVRKVPRRTVSFSVMRDSQPFSLVLERRRVPRPFVDYDVGDIVTFRAVELVEQRDAGGRVTATVEVVTLDLLMRVHAMEIAPDTLNGETVTLLLQQEGD